MAVRTAIVAGTPWQVMGALALAYSGTCGSASDIDLYLRPGFSNARSLVSRLRDETLFNTVAVVALKETESLDARGVNKGANEAASSSEMLDGQLDQPMSDRRYGRVFCSYPYDTVAYLLALSPDAELDLYDDGLGSYVGNILLDNGGYGLPEPSKVYLRAPELARISFLSDIRQLPINLKDSSFLALVKRAFGVKDHVLDLYANFDTVFLTQPIDTRSNRYRDVTQMVLETLAQSPSRVIVRRHPRDTTAINRELALDNTGVPWEIACALGAIRQDMTLVAECSTAQLTPKLISGNEPRIVFLADLYASFSGEPTSSLLEELIDMITSTYADKGRIHRPQNINELALTIEG